MTESAEVQDRIGRLEEMDAIKRLKYKYVRCVDSRLWDELALCFIQDATTNYGERCSPAGLGAITDLFRKYKPPDVITMHHVHHPGIELTGAETPEPRGHWRTVSSV